MNKTECENVYKIIEPIIRKDITNIIITYIKSNLDKNLNKISEFIKNSSVENEKTFEMLKKWNTNGQELNNMLFDKVIYGRHCSGFIDSLIILEIEDGKKLFDHTYILIDQYKIPRSTKDIYYLLV